MVRSAALFFLAMSMAAPSARAEDAAAGEAQFKRQCAACHRLGPGRAMGPNLQGVFGRPAGSVEGYRYSAAMKGLGQDWTVETLTRFLKRPRAMVPGTAMPFAGIQSDEQVSDIVAFLRNLPPAP